MVPGPGPVAVNDGDSVSFDPLAGASDVDGDALTMVAYDATSAFGGTVVEGSLIYTAPINASGRDTFGYRVSDGTDVVPVTVRVSVNDVNYPPVFGGSPELTVDENTPGTVDVLGGASDRDGDPITIGAIDTTSTAGTVVDNGDGTITYTPALNWAGTDAFTVDLTDGENVVPVLIRVTVNDTNDPLVTPPGQSPPPRRTPRSLLISSPAPVTQTGTPSPWLLSMCRAPSERWSTTAMERSPTAPAPTSTAPTASATAHRWRRDVAGSVAISVVRCRHSRARPDIRRTRRTEPATFTATGPTATETRWCSRSTVRPAAPSSTVDRESSFGRRPRLKGRVRLPSTSW